MMTKHTPIPWRVADKSLGLMGILRVQNKDVDICNVFNDKSVNSEANAKHIVKCVNMHDELVEALDKMINHTGIETEKQYLKWHIKAEEVLEKAKEKMRGE